MMRAVLFCVAVGVFSGCADQAGGLDGGVALNVAALSLSDVSYAQYTITVKDSGGTTVSTAQIDSDAYSVGSDPTQVRYVAPCDASDSGNGQVIVQVDDLQVGGTSLPAAALPPAQTKSVDCTANASTQVDFQFYAYAPAELGFFDLLIGTQVAYCSAKLDCDASTSSFFPASADGGVVLGFSCTVANSADARTALRLDDIVVDCGGAGSATISPAVPGNLDLGTYVSGTAGLVDDVTVFRGQDTLSNADNVYWNVAIGLTETATAASCSVKTHGGVSERTAVVNDRPYVDWNVPVTNAGGDVTCSNQALFGAGSGVTLAWPAQGTAEAFDHFYMGHIVAFVTADLVTPGTAFDAFGSPDTFASLSDADAICDSYFSGFDPGTRVAWLSDSTTDAADRIPDEAVRLVTGTRVAAGKADLLDGSLLHAIDATYFGTTATDPVWTGTLSDGTVDAAHTCSDWTSGSAGATGLVGTQSATATWTDDGTAACNTGKRLLCIWIPF